MDFSELLILRKKIDHAIQIAKEYYNPLGIKLRKNIDKMLYKYDSKQTSMNELAKREI